MTKMESPICLKSNIDMLSAIEVIDYLYCDKYITRTSEEENGKTVVINWFDKNTKLIAKWTNEYRNLMISKKLLDNN